MIDRETLDRLASLREHAGFNAPTEITSVRNGWGSQVWHLVAGGALEGVLYAQAAADYLAALIGAAEGLIADSRELAATIRAKQENDERLQLAARRAEHGYDEIRARIDSEIQALQNRVAHLEARTGATTPNKIALIRDLHNITGCGLGEGKNALERHDWNLEAAKTAILGEQVRRHGWTRHGHACCSYMGDAEPTDRLVAKCGGAALCGQCASDMALIHSVGARWPQTQGTA